MAMRFGRVGPILLALATSASAFAEIHVRGDKVVEIDGRVVFTGSVTCEITNQEVHVAADAVTITENGRVFDGSVELTSGDKLIRTDRLVVKQVAHVTHVAADAVSIHKIEST